MDGLKKIAEDKISDWFTRASALEGLAGITINSPEVEKDIFLFVNSILKDEVEDRDLRSSAGNILLEFVRKEYQDDLIEFSLQEKKLVKENEIFIPSFDEDYDLCPCGSGKKYKKCCLNKESVH